MNSVKKKMRSLSAANFPVDSIEELDDIPGMDSFNNNNNIGQPIALESREVLYDPAYPRYEGSPDPLHGVQNSVTSAVSWNEMTGVQPSANSTGRAQAGQVPSTAGEIIEPMQLDPARDSNHPHTIVIDPSLEMEVPDTALSLLNHTHRMVDNLSPPDGQLSEAPAQATRNESRTPSLRIHTNGTESTIESKSDQSSPLTEIVSSPTLDNFQHFNETAEVIIKSESPQTTRQTPRQRKQVERFSETIFEKPKDNRSDHNTTRGPSLPVSSSKKSTTRTTPASGGRRNSQIAVAELTRRAQTYSPSLKDPMLVRAASSTEEAEDESVRLVRELTEQEFGLRRRSK